MVIIGANHKELDTQAFVLRFSQWSMSVFCSSVIIQVEIIFIPVRLFRDSFKRFVTLVIFLPICMVCAFIL